MNFLPRRHERDNEEMLSPEDSVDSMTGEVIDSGYTPDRNNVWYRLQMPDGTTREHSLPMRRLNVRFTTDGPVYLSDENH